jgi:MSP1 EGF domain 1
MEKLNICFLLLFFSNATACGNWMWGDNCTTLCNCIHNNTIVCEKYQGSCLCASNFEGSSCEKFLDRCSLYSPCDQHSDCINKLGDYECQCHNGYKKNPLNPNICEGIHVLFLFQMSFAIHSMYTVGTISFIGRIV